MKKLLATVVVLSAVAVVNSGCEKTKVASPSGDKTLTLTKPSNVTIKQGESNTVKVEIARKGFNEPVDIHFDNLPSGVTVEDRDHQIPKDSTSTTFNLKATAEAKPVNDHPVSVWAKGGGLETPKESFNVTVKAK